MVRRVSAPRMQFEAAAVYEYPDHLRPWLEDLPKASGVYVFHGESDVMPLYIGKSVNIRSRVMSHFRTPDEAALLRQSRRITFIRTAGELGALLLEAQMIKEQQPLFNKRLRRNRQLCSLQFESDKPQVVYARDVDFSKQTGLYGLYANRRAALQTLQTLADEHQLCYGLLGLETLSTGRACFRAGLKRCAGACCGRETVETHRARFLAAMERIRVMCWPWQGPVGLKESGPDITQYHIIDSWFYLGSVENLKEARSLAAPPKGFDNDGYKILCKLVMSGDYEVVELTRPTAS
ncbi:excinuclease Cho [Enterobacteriaceae bacterium H20N1]|uniref:Excinuclease cho n=1 Tax=Dryocola boscaweniae TaxID=2925397 RepID=A0A9X2WAU5_9ENTR|nr:excinuclease Cho [Dryocola boscaweniae]MCT4704109.1 excinuclease Cho [Dryocola boscaweniae]MCT4721277.1 excinuclease Cho [Dryocola boscaweniae]